MESMLTTTLD